MKLYNTLTFALSLSAASFTSFPSIAKESIVGLSPIGTPEQKLAEIRAIGTYLAETTNAGETSVVVNALDQSEIARFIVPDDTERYDNPRSKMRANRPFFRDTKVFAETATAPSDENFAGQIDLPAFLRTVGLNYPAKNPRDLILYGVSPVTHYVLDPGHSMLDGVLPDHDHVAASRGNSPYGTAEQTGKLTNYTLHWGMRDTDWAVSDRHQHFMEEYISLSASVRGATLSTLAATPDTALRNAKAGIDASIGDYTLAPDGTLEMIHFRPKPAEQSHDTSIPIYERVLSDRVPERGELSAAQGVELAIRWECGCDFDLAVKPHGGAIISFREPQSADGRLYKDFTSSQDLNNGWETVALSGRNGSVDLTQILVAINLFSGTGRNHSVELRIAIAGETWGKRFEIRGSANGGTGFEQTLSRGRPANNAWIVPDLAKLLGGAS